MRYELRKTIKLAGALLLAVIVGGAAVPAMAEHRDQGHDKWAYRDIPPGHYKHFKGYRKHYEPRYAETYPAPRVYDYYAPRRYSPSADLSFNLNIPLF